MQKLIATIILALLPVVAPLSAQAQALEDRVADALAAQGFHVMSMNKTWLGRLRVVAESDALYRELVFDPATGEILQDYVAKLSDRQRADDLAAAAKSHGHKSTATTTGTSSSLPSEDWSDVVAEPSVGVSVVLPSVSAAGDGG